MPNKHQIQRDFYTKMSKWKKELKVDKKETKCSIGIIEHKENKKMTINQFCNKVEELSHEDK